MYKKDINYTDYNGVERAETHYFNLNKAEVMEMEMSKKGGLAEEINRIIAAQDAPAIMETFKSLIRKSYGVKSADGKRFFKSPELWEEFEQSEAYPTFYMELATDAEEASRFINGIVPADLSKAVNASDHPALK